MMIRYSAKMMGICRSRGRQPEVMEVPYFSYRAFISACCAIMDALSVLFSYFF